MVHISYDAANTQTVAPKFTKPAENFLVVGWQVASGKWLRTKIPKHAVCCPQCSRYSINSENGTCGHGISGPSMAIFRPKNGPNIFPNVILDPLQWLKKKAYFVHLGFAFTHFHPPIMCLFLWLGPVWSEKWPVFGPQ